MQLLQKEQEAIQETTSSSVSWRRKREGRSKKEKEILSIIQHEKNRGVWRRLNKVMGKPCSELVRRVLVENKEQEGMSIENNTKESVQEAIFDNIHRKRFFLAEAAPICNGILWEQFGYNTNTKTARKVLSGSYIYPPEFHQATHEICEECASMQCIIPKNSLDIIITRDKWSQQLRVKQESTFSSESGLHLGHYITGCESD
jgi:hypothetical protein